MNPAWLAGFLDGEGSFFVSRVVAKGRYVLYRPRVYVSNTHEPTIRAIESYWAEHGWAPGTGLRTGPRRADIHRVELVSWASVAGGVNDVLEYLVTKWEAAALLLEWAEERVSEHERVGRFGASYTERDHERYFHLRELNKRWGSVDPASNEATIAAVSS